jgi:hypothetical protein
VRLDATGEGSFEAFVAAAFLPLALIWFVGLFPAGQRGRVRLNSGGTSRVVGKQGERGEAKVSSGQTRLRTRWRGRVKERRSVTTRERGEDPSTFRFTITINLFITILIGLKLPTFLFYVWTEDIFLFGPFTGILSIRKGTLR